MEASSLALIPVSCSHLARYSCRRPGIASRLRTYRRGSPGHTSDLGSDAHVHGRHCRAGTPSAFLSIYAKSEMRHPDTWPGRLGADWRPSGVRFGSQVGATDGRYRRVNEGTRPNDAWDAGCRLPSALDPANPLAVRPVSPRTACHAEGLSIVTGGRHVLPAAVTRPPE